MLITHSKSRVEQDLRVSWDAIRRSYRRRKDKAEEFYLTVYLCSMRRDCIWWFVIAIPDEIDKYLGEYYVAVKFNPDWKKKDIPMITDLVWDQLVESMQKRHTVISTED